MKFVHCADVHLDSPLRGLSAYEGAPSERIRGASRRALERVVKLAIDEQAELVIFAGDLFDGDRDDVSTAMFLQRQLHVLASADIAVAIAFGNHDAANDITYRLRPPEGVFVFPSEAPATFAVERAGVVLHGQSYASRAVLDDLSLGYPAPSSGGLNVGVLHTSLDGRPGHDPYAPCSPEHLAAMGYAYWALGHVHSRELINRDGVDLAFPGNLQGRHVRETGPKGVLLVEHDGYSVSSISPRDLAPVRWERCTFDLVAEQSADDVLGSLVASMTAIQAQSEAELTAVRVEVTVSTAVHERWLADAVQLEAQLRADATGDGDSLWIERVLVRPGDGADREPAGEAIGAIQSAIEAMLNGEDPSGRADMESVLSGIRTRFAANLDEVIAMGADAVAPEHFPDLLRDVEALLVGELGGLDR